MPKSEMMSPEMQKAAETLEALRKVAKPTTQMAVGADYGLVFFEGRGTLDLHPSVVAVPIPVILEIVAALHTNMLAPMLRAMPVKKMSVPVMEGRN